MKQINAKEFTFVINEEQCLVSILLNRQIQKVPSWKDATLYYIVNSKEKSVYVHSKKYMLKFFNLNEQMIYYLHKTKTLILIFGDQKEKFNPKIVFEAVLNFDEI